MEATRPRSSDQLDEERQFTTGVAGKTPGPFRDQKVTAVGQRYQQDEDKCQKTKAALPEREGYHSFTSLGGLHLERLQKAKDLVEKAVRRHKVFSVRGRYPVIREALRARGWVEKRMRSPNNRPRPHHSTDSYDDDGSILGDIEKDTDPTELHDLMSEKVYFYWTKHRDHILAHSLQKEPIINHFAKAGNFTTKVGLCLNLRNLLWFDSADPNTFFPRCYTLGAQDEKQAFIEDYRRTACISLLKYIVMREQHVYGEGRSSSHSQMKQGEFRPVRVYQMVKHAMKVCQKFLESLEHRDIDLETSRTFTSEEWAEFLNNYYLIVHDRAEIGNSSCYVESCKAMLQRLEEVCPQLDIDGTNNIWIIKPGAKSRGRGIKCVKRLDQIFALVKEIPTALKYNNWVVQKYVERPLLVHGTKFDVRQWFLVTDWNPLTVWFYKKCYLRFSTQPYSLDRLDRSVHLCNNSIQKHLRPSTQRHPEIPADNMWSDEQIRVFLASEGQEAQWEAVVIPGMKKAIVHTLKTTQDLMEARKNTFELYGADFIIGRDLHPWLIEINASPTMAPSTAVTAQLCAAVQEDTIRVVLDYRADCSADTGDFELIYEQVAVEAPKYKGVSLLVEGFKITNCWAPKHHAPLKYKDPKAEKAKPKVSLSCAETQVKRNSSNVLLQFPSPPVTDPAKAICGSTRAQSRSAILGKKNKAPKGKKDKFQSRPKQRQERSCLELIVSKPPSSLSS